MATNLTKNINREVESSKHGALTVTFTPHGVITREKGSRDSFGPVPWSSIHDLAMKIEAGFPTTRRSMRRRG